MAREFQESHSPVKILVRGARQLITVSGPAGPWRGAALNELGIIRDGALLLQGEKCWKGFRAGDWKTSPGLEARGR